VESDFTFELKVKSGARAGDRRVCVEALFKVQAIFAEGGVREQQGDE
jgi:hypothetical protein